MKNATTTLCLALLFAGGKLEAQSQPPSPTPSKLSGPPQKQPAAQTNATQYPERQPSAIPILKGEAEPREHADTKDQQTSQEDDKAASDRLANWLMVVFNGLLVIITVALGWIAWIQNKTTHTIERGYIGLSHYPPGIEFTDLKEPFVIDGVERKSFTVSLQVKNWGNTPGTVTAVHVEHHIGDSLPDRPAYGTREEDEAGFLGPNSSFRFERRIVITAEQRAAIAGDRIGLWLIGYVDYIDRFNGRHRSGYARRYDPDVDVMIEYAAGRADRGVFNKERYDKRNNLPIEPKPGYNYDRPRKKGEGNDWP
jgi:hypothetical protein